MSTDQDNIRMSLGNAGSDCSHTYRRNKLDVDARLMIGVFKIMNKLSQILNGIDIMMRRRRNQANTGS